MICHNGHVEKKIMNRFFLPGLDASEFYACEVRAVSDYRMEIFQQPVKFSPTGKLLWGTISKKSSAAFYWQNDDPAFVTWELVGRAFVVFRNIAVSQRILVELSHQMVDALSGEGSKNSVPTRSAVLALFGMFQSNRPVPVHLKLSDLFINLSLSWEALEITVKTMIAEATLHETSDGFTLAIDSKTKLSTASALQEVGINPGQVIGEKNWLQNFIMAQYGNQIWDLDIEPILVEETTQGHTSNDHPDDSLVSDLKWRVVKLLGKGGQGRAEQVVRSDGFVAVRKYLIREGGQARFKNEVAALQKIESEYVLKLIDADTELKEPWLMTEFCAGGTLTKAAVHHRTIPEIIKLFKQVCLGVQAMHKADLLHRDIKPDNVLLREVNGPAVVGDLGLVFDLEQPEDRRTRLDESVGPKFYMAPEYEEGRVENPTIAGDIYSLGKLFYFMLTGKIFTREKHRTPDWDLVRKFNDDSFEHVNRMLDYMIVENPSNRFENMQKVFDNLELVRYCMEGRYPVLDPARGITCRFCGLGNYTVYLHTKSAPGDISNAGFGPVTGTEWRSLRCERCGHLELFHVQNVRAGDWFRK
jgi:Protein kinase domain